MKRAEHRAPVVCLGYNTVQNPFPEGKIPHSKRVTIDGQLFTVIGTMEKRRQGISGGSNPEDNIASCPSQRCANSTQPERLRNFRQSHDPSQVSQAVEEMRDLLRRKRRLSTTSPTILRFSLPIISRPLKQNQFPDFLLMFCISAIGLLVGGIGVMNIMLVSVTERTREIGAQSHRRKTQQHPHAILIEAVTSALLWRSRRYLWVAAFPSHEIWPRHVRAAFSLLGGHGARSLRRHWRWLRHLSRLESRRLDPVEALPLRNETVTATSEDCSHRLLDLLYHLSFFALFTAA